MTLTGHSNQPETGVHTEIMFLVSEKVHLICETEITGSRFVSRISTNKCEVKVASIRGSTVNTTTARLSVCLSVTVNAADYSNNTGYNTTVSFPRVESREKKTITIHLHFIHRQTNRPLQKIKDTGWSLSSHDQIP